VEGGRLRVAHEIGDLADRERRIEDALLGHLAARGIEDWADRR